MTKVLDMLDITSSDPQSEDYVGSGCVDEEDG